MKLEYTITVDDLVRYSTQSTWNASFERIRWLLWLGGLTLLPPVVWLASGELGVLLLCGALSLVLILLSVLPVMILPIQNRWRINRLIRRRGYTLPQRVIWEIDDEGILITRGDRPVRLRWEQIRRFEEVGDRYFIYTGQVIKPGRWQIGSARYYVTRSAFASPEQEQAFRELLREKTGLG